MPVAGARRAFLSLVLAASAFVMPAALAAGLRIGSVESIAPTETSSPRAAAADGATPGRRTVSFEAFGRSFELLLEANPGFAAAAAAAGVDVAQGTVAGHSGSWVRLTRIGGVWTGLVFDGRDYFAMDRAAQTTEFNAQATRLPAAAPVAWQLSDARIEDGAFVGDLVTPGLSLTEAAEAVNAEMIVPPTANAMLVTKRLDVGVLVDPEQEARDLGLGSNAQQNALARMNVVDGIFQSQVGVRVTVSAVTSVPAGTFTSTAADTLLEQLRDYRAASGPQQANGLTHLITGRDLDGNTVGIAYLGGLCNSRFGDSLSEGRRGTQVDGLIAAHEIGHTFNAPHDTESGSACEAAPAGYLMGPQVSSGPNGGTFSDCSLTQMQPVLTTARCLAPVDAPDAALGAPVQVNVATAQPSPVVFTVRSSGNTTVSGVNFAATLVGATAASATVSGGGTCTVQPARVDCAIGDMATGTTRTVTIDVVAPVGGTGLRIDSALTAQNDQLATNNGGRTQLNASPGADLAVSVAFDATGIPQNGTGTAAHVVVRNNGLNAVSDALLTLTLDAGLSVTGTSGSLPCTATGNSVTCPAAAIATNASLEAVLQVQGTAAGVQRLSARVSSSAVDPAAGNNEASASVSVAAPAPVPTPATPPSGGGGGGRVDALLLALLAAGFAGALHSRRGRGAALAVAAVLVGLAAPPRASAESAPLWEVGFGAGALAFSDYRGADSSHVYPLPVPYLVYRGRWLQADRDGVRSLLMDRPRATLGISVNATTPVDSDGIAARADMPDLDSTLEAGPALDLHAWRSDDERLRLDVRLPLRATFTVSSDPRFIGWQFAPHLNLDVRDPFGAHGWNLGLLAGPLFAQRRYHDYYYSVAPAFATPERPAYAATSGFAGSQFIVSASKRFESTWFGAFARYDRLDGAVFEDSPLVRRKSAFMAGFGFVWILAKSPVLVDVGD